MSWFACDNGHKVAIPPTTLKVTRLQCPQCIDGTHYRIEIDTPEDDPARLRVKRTVALRNWLTNDTNTTRDRLDRARGALQQAGLPSPHIHPMDEVSAYGTPAPQPGQGVLAL